MTNEILHSNYALIVITDLSDGTTVTVGAAQDITIRYTAGNMAELGQIGSSDIAAKMPSGLRSEVSFRTGLIDLNLLQQTMDLDKTTARGNILPSVANSYQSGIFDKFTLVLTLYREDADTTTDENIGSYYKITIPDIRLSSYEISVTSGEYIIANADGIGDAPKIELVSP